MCLLFGLEPGTVKFDYGNPEFWPEGSAIVYKLLTSDIRAEKLFVVIEDPHRDPRISEYFSEIYGLSGNPWWADAEGKLFKRQLIEWLEAKGISSDFFGMRTFFAKGSWISRQMALISRSFPEKTTTVALATAFYSAPTACAKDHGGPTTTQRI